ncbi:MAG: DUF4276 family protein [Candidatus Hydrogenedentales bacterium]
MKRLIKQDTSDDARFSTMVDLYSYPKNVPGYEEIQSLDAYERVMGLEESLAADIASQRFVPYIQLHEFETLLYADLSRWEPVLNWNSN